MKSVARHGHDGVERFVFKSDSVHITMHPLDSPAFVSLTRSVENGPIYVKRYNLGHACLREFGRENAVSTPDLKDT